MIWIIIICVLFAVIITILAATAHKAKQSSAPPKAKASYNPAQPPEYHIIHCNNACEFAKELGENRFWCTKHNKETDYDDICDDSIAYMAKKIVEFNNLS